MFEHDLDVALQYQTLLLLLCQQENDAVLFLTVKFLSWISELLSDVKTSATVHFKEREAPAA